MTRAQKPLVGIVMSIAESDPEVSSRREAILEGLGRSNLKIVLRFGRKNPQDALVNYDEVARKLIKLKPDVIFSSCWPTMTALSNQTKSIPIVYAGLFSKEGQEKDYDFGKNVTGFVSHEFDVCKFWPRLLRKMAPNATKAAVIFESISAGGTNQRLAVENEAGNFVTQIDLTRNNSVALLKAAIAQFKRDTKGRGGLIVTSGALTATLGATIIGLAAENKLPAIYPNRLYTIHGGLMSYGADLLDLYRGAGRYLGRILDGATPGQLATQINQYFELVINRDTAKSLGLKVSSDLKDQASLLIGD